MSKVNLLRSGDLLELNSGNVSTCIWGEYNKLKEK